MPCFRCQQHMHGVQHPRYVQNPLVELQQGLLQRHRQLQGPRDPATHQVSSQLLQLPSNARPQHRRTTDDDRKSPQRSRRSRQRPIVIGHGMVGMPPEAKANVAAAKAEATAAAAGVQVLAAAASQWGSERPHWQNRPCRHASEGRGQGSCCQGKGQGSSCRQG